MAKTKGKSAKETSFFEEEVETKQESAKMSQPFNASNAHKNTLYKYKDGVTCRVVYDGKDANYIERTIGS